MLVYYVMCCHIFYCDIIFPSSQGLESSLPQFQESLTQMEELSATFSPHLSESDRASVYNQITENTNNLRKLDSEVQKKKDHLNSDIEEVFIDNTCFLHITHEFKRDTPFLCFIQLWGTTANNEWYGKFRSLQPRIERLETCVIANTTLVNIVIYLIIAISRLLIPAMLDLDARLNH